MNSNKLLRFFVVLMGILTANFVSTKIDEFMLSYKGTTSPYVFTWVGMLIVIAVYYPLFSYIDRWSILLSSHLFRKGKRLIGKTYGIYIVFLVVLLILYSLYLQLWFNLSIISFLVSKVGF